ncbi:hypothetical protein os1_10730 [Comamonadaceae bacterium OS-1]|nr:hypothetical protein os1_10730 [Comamonadaceae bacterium OS-1]
MYDLLLFLNSGASFAYVIWAFFNAKKHGTIITAFVSSMYILTNGAFIFSNQETSSLYGYDISDQAIVLACLGNFLFILISILITKIKFFKTKIILGYKADSSPRKIILLVLIFLVVILESRYLFLGGGIQRVLELSNVSGRDSLYTLRYDDSLAISQGSGLFSALIAMRVIYPLCALGLAHKIIVKKNYYYIIPAAFILTSNGLTALSTLQRSPFFNFTVISLFSVAWAILLSRQLRGEKMPIFGLKQFIILALCVLMGSSIYAFTEGVNLALGAYGIAERIFFISSFSTTSYYNLFGEKLAFPYVGISYLLGFPVEEAAGVITYRNIGSAANGWPHNLNASFVGTAYAALGYFGVVLISFIVLYVTKYIDSKLKYMSITDKFAALILNIFVVFEVCNGPLMNGIYAGLLTNVLLYIFIFKSKVKYAYR